MSGKEYDSVWDALCDSSAEAENMKVRSELMNIIRDHVKRKQLDTKAIQRKLGLTQPRVSYLMTGKIDKFSLDALVKMASRAGLHISITASEEAAA